MEGKREEKLSLPQKNSEFKSLLSGKKDLIQVATIKW